MANVPTPPPHAPYYRGEATNLDPNQLRSLKEGYFGLNTIFFINIALALGSNVLLRGEFNSVVFLVVVGAMFVIISLATFPSNKKIGQGMGWPAGNAVLASVLMGLNSALCCGIIGYVVMQNIALKGMARFGIKAGLFGLKKSVVEQRIAELERTQYAPNMPPPASPGYEYNLGNDQDPSK